MPDPTPGQIAYAAYLQRFVAYQHHASGTVMPEPWAHLPLLVQICWEVAANAVLDALLSSAQRLVPPQEEAPHAPL